MSIGEVVRVRQEVPDMDGFARLAGSRTSRRRA
jgi:hypothetical protein